MRKYELERTTRETKIKLKLNLDGKGRFIGDFPIPYWKHLLETLIFYASFDLEMKAEGDIDVDFHHLVEDVGLCLGTAFYNIIYKYNFKRFSNKIVPMDDALVMTSLDISRRPYLNFKDNSQYRATEHELVKEFLRAFVNESKITLHVIILYGENIHHIQEAIFKSLGMALKEACEISDTTTSTKGII